jgi:hypothetical protein
MLRCGSILIVRADSGRNQFQSEYLSYQYVYGIPARYVIILFKLRGRSQVIAYHPTSPYIAERDELSSQRIFS